MTTYKSEFFPDKSFLEFDVFFENEEIMIRDICGVMEKYLLDIKLYELTNKKLLDKYNYLYSFEDYVKKVNMLIDRRFELYPGTYNSKGDAPAFRFGAASNFLA